MSIEIGEIGNAYGSLEVTQQGDKYYWTITGYEGGELEEISKSLYEELIKHQRMLDGDQYK